MAAPTRSCRLLYLWLEPEVFRFVPMKSVDAFTASARTLKKARQYTKALDMSKVIIPDYTESSKIGPITLHPWFIFLEGHLEKLCVPSEYLTSLPRASVFVRDITLIHDLVINVGGIRCERLRLALNYENNLKWGHEDHIWTSANIFRDSPFNDSLWSSLHKQVTSFAFEMSLDGSFRVALDTIYDFYSKLKFKALRNCITIVYFSSQDTLEQFREEGKTLAVRRPENLQIVYLLLQDYEQWTFRSLEWSREDFWEKIQTRFEPLS